MSTTFSSDVSGGTLPLSYVYSPLPMGCATADLASFVCTPTSLGTVTTELTVTDSVGVVVTANVTVLVSPPLTSGSLTTDPAVVTVSVPFNLSAGSVGGSTPLTYAFAGLAGELLQSGPPRPRPALPARGDLLDLRKHHRRSRGGRLGSGLRRRQPATLRYGGREPLPIPLGDEVTFTVTASGGTNPLTYSYSGLPTGAGCISTNSSTLTCRPNATGTFTVSANVTDLFGRSASAPVVVTVVGNTAPSSGGSLGSLPWWVWLLVGIVVVVAILALYLLFRRRSPPPASEEPPTNLSSTPGRWVRRGGLRPASDLGSPRPSRAASSNTFELRRRRCDHDPGTSRWSTRIPPTERS